MKRMMMSLAALLVLTGCGVKETTVVEVPLVDPALLEAMNKIVGSPVETAEQMAIPAIKGKVDAGTRVTLEGKVMGSKYPFVSNRAVVIIGDEATIESCELMGDDDHCKTPWDACCEDSTNIRAGTATVQVVGEDGKPLHAGLKGVGGLKELSRVRVSGVVAEGSSGANLIVNAEAIQLL